MRKITKLIIHCSDTPTGMDIGAKEIDSWHKQKGWEKIGYHYVIKRNGEIEKGREDKEVGAHCMGKNKGSIGVCWVGGKDGEDNRTPEQKVALKDLVGELQYKYPRATTHGHCEFANKKCPCFNVKEAL